MVAVIMPPATLAMRLDPQSFLAPPQPHSAPPSSRRHARFATTLARPRRPQSAPAPRLHLCGPSYFYCVRRAKLLECWVFPSLATISWRLNGGVPHCPGHQLTLPQRLWHLSLL